MCMQSFVRCLYFVFSKCREYYRPYCKEESNACLRTISQLSALIFKSLVFKGFLSLPPPWLSAPKRIYESVLWTPQLPCRSLLWSGTCIWCMPCSGRYCNCWDLGQFDKSCACKIEHLLGKSMVRSPMGCMQFYRPFPAAQHCPPHAK